MTSPAQRREVDDNYDAFQRVLRTLLTDHAGQYALMRTRRVVGFFDSPGEALRRGIESFSDSIFSIQEVTDEPIDLGFWSHVEH